MKYLLLTLIATALVSAKTHVVLQTDVVQQNVDLEATIYRNSQSTYTSGTSTSVAAPVSVATYKTTVISSSVPTTTVAPVGTTQQGAPAPANTQAQAKDAAPAGSAAAAPAAAPASSAAAAPAAAASAGSSTGGNQFATNMLNEHNKKRALHQGVNALTWSSELASYAQNYADKYSCPSNGALIHSQGKYGENLASGYSDVGTVDAWYDEIKQYNYNAPGFNEATGHFSQVIWKGSQQLGCAYKDCNNAWGKYVVCEYYPMGNIVVTGSTTYWSQNVPPLK